MRTADAPRPPVRPAPEPVTPPADRAVDATTTAGARMLAVIRVTLGWVFLWAFLDKTFGLGLNTAREAAWINGGEPTRGFLVFGTEGAALHDVFAAMAGPVADWLFMIGLLGIGVALILGIGMRVAGVAGAVMMTLMWLAVLPLANNPIIDDHLVYALVIAALPLLHAGRTWGLGRWWERQQLVRRFPVLT